MRQEAFLMPGFSASQAPPFVLIIDDDVAVGVLLQAVLIEEGYQTRLVRHALSAREVARLAPDTLVLDLRLGPTEAGYELLQALNADAGTRQIPVVVCSADVLLLRREATRLQVLAASVVPKPFDVDDFVARVAEACSGGLRGTP
jgi:CheY-like chemotaxis protein